jgi:hypothetical protein
MPKNGNGMARKRRGQSNQTGPSRTPSTTLRRTFRYTKNIKLNNTTGSGLDQYAYYSKYLYPDPAQALGFKDAQQTFEFFKINRMRVKAQPSYNSYNQTYNTINLDSVAAMQVWTAADFSTNENISGVSIMSYNNARCHTLSLNGLKTVVNTKTVLNQQNLVPRTILPANSWLDTSNDISSSNVYSGAQIFIRMPGMDATNYLPSVQLIFEIDVEFKQPAYQNRPTLFESDFVGSLLSVIPSSSTPEVTREYKVVSYTLNDSGNNVRLERTDGQPGSLDYTQEEFWEVTFYRTSGQYFGNRAADYTGPVPRKPLGWNFE